MIQILSFADRRNSRNLKDISVVRESPCQIKYDVLLGFPAPELPELAARSFP